MKTVNVRDLRISFSKLEARLSEGVNIRIEKRGRPTGLLAAWRPDAPDQPAKPDFAARRRAIGGNVFLLRRKSRRDAAMTSKEKKYELLSRHFFSVCVELTGE